MSSNIKRKHILMDLDNVVYPWAEVMAMVVAMNTEIADDPDSLMKLYHTWRVWDDWGIPEGQFRLWWERAIKEGIMYSSGPIGPAGGVYGYPLQGAVSALWQISDAEWHINLCTSRLNMFRHHDTAVENTVKWLQQFGVPYRSLTFIDEKDRITADVIVDDKPSNLIHNAPLKFLYPAAHNREWLKAYERLDHQDIIILGEEYPWSELVEQLGSGLIE